MTNLPPIKEPNVTRERIISQLEYHQFQKHKDILLQKIVDVIRRLQPSDYLERWKAGEIEHGLITAEVLQEMNLDRELEEEVKDAFWYHIMSHVQEIERKKSRK